MNIRTTIAKTFTLTLLSSSIALHAMCWIEHPRYAPDKRDESHVNHALLRTAHIYIQVHEKPISPAKQQELNAALMNAISQDDIRRARLLIAGKASVTCCDTKGQTPLMLASQEKNTEIVELLLAKNATPGIDAQDLAGRTALMHAARKFRSSATQSLLNASAKTEICDYEGNTALHHAVRHGHDSAVTALIQAGASVFEPYNKDKKSPYDYAGTVTARGIANAIHEKYQALREEVKEGKKKQLRSAL